jgi:ABC-type transport system involved in multi-copper enzyme maturation permease subunit
MTLSLVFGYVFPYFSYRGTPSGPTADANLGERVLAEALPSALVPAAIQGFPLFAGALALLIGVLATGSEYGWDTMKVLLTLGPRRLSVLAGKLLALTVVMLLVVPATLVVDAMASLLIAAITGNPVHWPPSGALLTGIAAGWLVVGMWCLAGAFLGILVRGTALAVGIGLVWALAVENLLRIFGSIVEVVDVVQRFLPGTNAGALAAALGVPVQGQPGGTPGVTDVVGGMSAALVLAAYLAMFVAASAALISRRDVA